MADEKKTSLEADEQPPSRGRISRRAFLSGAAGAAALGVYSAPKLSLLSMAEAQTKGSPPKDEKSEMDKGEKDGTDKALNDKGSKEKDESDKGSKDGKDTADKDKTEKDAGKGETDGAMLAPDPASHLNLAAGPRRDEWS